MHVQIVEDDVELAHMLREQIRLSGHDARVWTSRFDLLLRPEPWEGVDGAIVDLWLERRGWEQEFPRALEVLNWLAEHRPNIRRVVYSAIDPRNLTADQIERINGLAQAYLTKPTRTEIILGALRG